MNKRLKLTEASSATTVEFYIDGLNNYQLARLFDPANLNLYIENLRVIYNRDDMPWSEFVRRASIDRNVTAVIREMQKQMRQSNFVGSNGGTIADLPFFIATMFGDNSAPFDVMIRDRTDKSADRHGTKQMVRVDHQEREKNDSRATAYMGYVYGQDSDELVRPKNYFLNNPQDDSIPKHDPIEADEVLIPELDSSSGQIIRRGETMIDPKVYAEKALNRLDILIEAVLVNINTSNDNKIREARSMSSTLIGKLLSPYAASKGPEFNEAIQTLYDWYDNEGMDAKELRELNKEDALLEDIMNMVDAASEKQALFLKVFPDLMDFIDPEEVEKDDPITDSDTRIWTMEILKYTGHSVQDAFNGDISNWRSVHQETIEQTNMPKLSKGLTKESDIERFYRQQDKVNRAVENEVVPKVNTILEEQIWGPTYDQQEDLLKEFRAKGEIDEYYRLEGVENLVMVKVRVNDEFKLPEQWNKSDYDKGDEFYGDVVWRFSGEPYLSSGLKNESILTLRDKKSETLFKDLPWNI